MLSFLFLLLAPSSFFTIFEKNCVSYEFVPFETLGVSFAI